MTVTTPRDARRKLVTCQRHIQISLIAQVILQYLAMGCRAWVAFFGSWLRAVYPGILRFELINAAALRNSLLDFLGGTSYCSIIQEFRAGSIDAGDYGAVRLAE